VDSRAVKPGDLFFALAGSKTDGTRFIDAAIASGAVAVAGDHPPPGELPRAVRRYAQSAPRAGAGRGAILSAQPATIAAVTGTSGKTSVAAFTRQIWQRLGDASASIGTIGLVSPKRTVYGSLTTPDPIALHRRSTKSRAMASPISRSRPRRTGSISIGSTACASPPAASPICRAITWIIILTSRIISPPSCGCSAISSPRRRRGHRRPT
jgi:hypothetical protein